MGKYLSYFVMGDLGIASVAFFLGKKKNDHE